MLNRETMTMPATEALIALDRSFVGTDDYMGVAYFWDFEYRHSMREFSAASLVRVHKAMLKAGLDVGGKSDAHAAIINREAHRMGVAT